MLLSAWLLVGATALVGMPAQAEPPEFGDTTATSHNGAMLIEWTAQGEPERFEVWHSRPGDADEGQRLYTGAMRSAHVSGLRDGTHVFRARALDQRGDWSDWSRPLRLNVQHHSMALVWPLLTLGALVFFATFGFVLRQVRVDEGAM